MKKKSWFKPKAFTHLTSKLTIYDLGWIQEYVSNPENIAKHKFLPLIHRTIVTKRLKKGKGRNGEVIKKHYTFENGRKKGTAKYREIYYATHLDSHVYSYFAQHILEPLYEQELKKNSVLNDSILAYRRIPVIGEDRCKSNIDFANEVFGIINNRKGHGAVLALDISKFFDSLDHKVLKKTWCELVGRKDLEDFHYTIYKNITRFSYLELLDLLKEFKYRHPNQLIQKEVNAILSNINDFKVRIKGKGLIKENPFRRVNDDQSKTVVGIPQGTPISALLANIYLLNFDKIIIEYLKNFNGTYRRYSDDILIVCDEKDFSVIAQFIYDSIKEFKLEIQPSKTQTSLFFDGKLKKGEKPVTYLGFTFDGRKKLLKSASVAKFYRKMRRAVRVHAFRAQAARRKNLNGSNYDETLHRKQLYNQFSFLGAKRSTFKKRNYISYANFAARIMESPEINRQLSQAWDILDAEIKYYETLYNLQRIKKRQVVKP